MDLPVPGLPLRIEARATFAGAAFITSSAIGQVQTGHNLASINIVHSYNGPTMPPARDTKIEALRQHILSQLLTTLGERPVAPPRKGHGALGGH